MSVSNDRYTVDPIFHMAIRHIVDTVSPYSYENVTKITSGRNYQISFMKYLARFFMRRFTIFIQLSLVVELILSEKRNISLKAPCIYKLCIQRLNPCRIVHDFEVCFKLECISYRLFI